MKRINLVLVLLMIGASLFASGFSVALSTSYSVPVYSNGSESIAYALNSGVTEEAEISYKAVSLSLGVGYNSHFYDGKVKIYNFPFGINTKLNMVTADALAIYTKAGIGADLKLDFVGKVYYLGPLFNVGLGADIKLAEKLSLGMASKVNVIYMVTGKELQVEYIPLSLSVKYEI